MEVKQDIVKQILQINSVEEEITISLIENIQKELEKPLLDMRLAYQRLKDEQMILKTTKDKTYGLQVFLQGKNDYTQQNWNRMRMNRKLAKECILILYHRTLEVLSILKLINKVNFTVTYIDNSKGKPIYTRLDNFVLDTTNTSLSGNALKMSESMIKKMAVKKWKDNYQIQDNINKHFQEFSEVYYDYASNNNTGWKYNNGRIAEAFERHWENWNHTIKEAEQSLPKVQESEGRRWVIYKKSSGNAAYYTGPDTAYSQVKNQNATVIHNIETVLNATDFIFKLINGEINIPEKTNQIKKALSAKETTTISAKIWDGMSQTVKNQISMDLIGTTNYKENRMGKSLVYLTKLDTEMT